MADRSSGSRPGSTSRSARSLLRDAGLSCSVVSPVAEQGWASWTYVVDGRWIARFPRNDEISDATRRELRLLPALARHVSFRVPEPVVWGDDWFAYELIPGRGLRAGDDIDAALEMIDELHTFPVELARSLLQRPSRIDAFAATKAAFVAEALPALPADLVSEVAFLMEPPPLEQEVFVHDDLNVEHVLVDERGRPVGIIDFEDATIGDPEVDRMPTCAMAGRPLTERMWFYWCRSCLHDVGYFTREGRPEEIPPVVAELRRRLSAEPRR